MLAQTSQRGKAASKVATRDASRQEDRVAILELPLRRVGGWGGFARRVGLHGFADHQQAFAAQRADSFHPQASLTGLRPAHARVQFERIRLSEEGAASRRFQRGVFRRAREAQHQQVFRRGARDVLERPGRLGQVEHRFRLADGRGDAGHGDEAGGGAFLGRFRRPFPLGQGPLGGLRPGMGGPAAGVLQFTEVEGGVLQPVRLRLGLGQLQPQGVGLVRGLGRARGFHGEGALNRV